MGIDELNLRHPAFARFMVVPHYAYLVMKMPAPKGIIKGSFTRSDNRNRVFNKISESFGMATEFEQLKMTTTEPLAVARVHPDQAFDTTKYTKEVQIHPIDPKKMRFVASNLGPA